MIEFRDEYTRMAQCALDEHRNDYPAARRYLFRRLQDVSFGDDLEKRLARQLIRSAIDYLDQHHRGSVPSAATDSGFAV